MSACPAEKTDTPQASNFEKRFLLFLLGSIFLLNALGLGGIKIAQAAVVDVTITSDGNFSPQSVTITAGDMIRWTSQSAGVEEPASNPHPTHEAYPALNVGPVSPGGSVTSPALTQVGTWGYHNHSCGATCSATIIIQAAASQSSGGFDICGVVDCVPPRLISSTVVRTNSEAYLLFTTSEAINGWFYVQSAFHNFTLPLTTTSSVEYRVPLPKLLPGTLYTYHFYLKDTAGNGILSPEQNFMTPPIFSTISTTTTSSTITASTTVRIGQPILEFLREQFTILKQKISQLFIKSGFRFTRPLAEGTRGQDVYLLQLLLSTDPAIYPEGFLTGYYGKLTSRAVGRFQVKFGVVASSSLMGSGSVDTSTIQKLNGFVQAFTLQ